MKSYAYTSHAKSSDSILMSTTRMHRMWSWHRTHCHRIGAISSIKLIWSANGWCVGTSRVTSSAQRMHNSIGDHNERSRRRCAAICIHCTRLCQIHFTDERQRQRYLWRSVLVCCHDNVVSERLEYAESSEGREKSARPATDRLTSHISHTGQCLSNK